MSYIYKITNIINGKSYIGKTNLSIEKRFKEHCRDSKKERCEKRPLYSAMNKYGIENFVVEQIDECSIAEVDEREKYWIEYFQTYKNGYNATKGGDGKAYLDYELIIKVYKETNNTIKTAKICECSPDAVRKVLHNNNIEIKTSQEVMKLEKAKPIAKLDLKTGEILEVFPSKTDAFRKGYTHAYDVANGKRKTCGGFGWKWL